MSSERRHVSEGLAFDGRTKHRNAFPAIRQSRRANLGAGEPPTRIVREQCLHSLTFIELRNHLVDVYFARRPNPCVGVSVDQPEHDFHKLFAVKADSGDAEQLHVDLQGFGGGMLACSCCRCKAESDESATHPTAIRCDAVRPTLAAGVIDTLEIAA